MPSGRSSHLSRIIGSKLVFAGCYPVMSKRPLPTDLQLRAFFLG